MKPRLIVAQFNPCLGELEKNTARIKAIIEKFNAQSEASSTFIIFPQLAITGYPPQDLLKNSRFIKKATEQLYSVAEICGRSQVLIGAPYLEQGKLYNSAALLRSDAPVRWYKNYFLNNTSWFQQSAYFSTSAEPFRLLDLDNFPLDAAVSVDGELLNPKFYTYLQQISRRSQKPLALINLSARPYVYGNFAKLSQKMAETAAFQKIYIIDANLVGGQDQLILEGGSSIFNPAGAMIQHVPLFKEECICLELTGDDPDSRPAPEGFQPGLAPSAEAAVNPVSIAMQDRQEAPPLSTLDNVSVDRPEITEPQADSKAQPLAEAEPEEAPQPPKRKSRKKTAEAAQSADTKSEKAAKAVKSAKGKAEKASAAETKQLEKANTDKTAEASAKTKAKKTEKGKAEKTGDNNNEAEEKKSAPKRKAAKTETASEKKSRRSKSSANSPAKIALSVIEQNSHILAALNGGADEKFDKAAEQFQAICLGFGDYMRKNNFTDAVLGISGGIDSALCAAIAVHTLGPQHVHGLYMPSCYSSQISQSEAFKLCKNLDIELRVVPIESMRAAFTTGLASSFAKCAPDVTEENIQARIRGILIMAMANKFGWLAICTANKDECACGYSTLYGDTAGAISPLADLYKNEIRTMCRYINRDREIIPELIITRPPSAELRPDQKDSDSLPDYDILDAILYRYLELHESMQEIIAAGFAPETVQKVFRLVERSEFKRRQEPFGLKLTNSLFGLDRIMPITNRYRE
ncbi:NAD(+) synthase [bacterium]|nr:NAD(+) synthase [bacterium]